MWRGREDRFLDECDRPILSSFVVAAKRATAGAAVGLRHITRGWIGQGKSCPLRLRPYPADHYASPLRPSSLLFVLLLPFHVTLTPLLENLARACCGERNCSKGGKWLELKF